MDSDYGLVIFDLDGTLFCSDPATIPAVQQCFAESGLRAPAVEDIREHIGPSEDEFHGWLRSLCPPDLAFGVVEAVMRREHQLVSQSGHLYSGVYQAVATLHANVGQMAICTYGRPDYAEEVLSNHGLAPFFDLVRCYRSPEDSKLQMIREVLGRLECRPGVMVGDRAVDIEAAHANGLRAIGVLYGYGSAEELACADAVASTAAQLPALVYSLLENGRVN